MENIEDKVPKEYKSNFNMGFMYSKFDSANSQKIVSAFEKNGMEQDDGIVAGMKEYWDHLLKELENENLREIEELRNPQGGEIEKDVNR